MTDDEPEIMHVRLSTSIPLTPEVGSAGYAHKEVTWASATSEPSTFVNFTLHPDESVKLTYLCYGGKTFKINDDNTLTLLIDNSNAPEVDYEDDEWDEDEEDDSNYSKTFVVTMKRSTRPKMDPKCPTFANIVWQSRWNEHGKALLTDQIGSEVCVVGFMGSLTFDLNKVEDIRAKRSLPRSSRCGEKTSSR